MVLCNGCNKNVVPIKIYEKKRSKEWLIHRCPKERCGFNIDIETYVKPKGLTEQTDVRRFFRNDYL